MLSPLVSQIRGTQKGAVRPPSCMTPFDSKVMSRISCLPTVRVRYRFRTITFPAVIRTPRRDHRVANHAVGMSTSASVATFPHALKPACVPAGDTITAEMMSSRTAKPGDAREAEATVEGEGACRPARPGTK